MKARAWKRLGAGLAAAILAGTGWLLWRHHIEEGEKAALVAEIEAERAARKWPAEPVATEAELDTADLYDRAILKMHVNLVDSDGGNAVDFYAEFYPAVEKAPWSAVPEPVTEILDANQETLALVDTASDRGACRFGEATPQPMGGHLRVLILLQARGQSALACGRPMAAAEEVRRLLRVGRDFGAASSPPGVEDGWPCPDILITKAEEHASGLLSSVASAPGLPPEVGSALAAAARDSWGSTAAFRRNIDWFEDSYDATALRLLGPDGAGWLARKNAQAAGLQGKVQGMLSASGLGRERNFFEKVRDRVTKSLRFDIRLPSAAEIREYRTARRPVIAAERQRDILALAPDGPLDRSGKELGALSPRSFRHSLADEARIVVARTAAAIRAFQLREGRPPRSLEEVVPAVLPEVPLDPFDGKPLLYEVAGDGWRVASRVWQDRFGPGAGEDYPHAEVRFPRPAK